MTAIHDWDVAGDAELAGAALAGNRVAFAQIYDRYADRLYDFCLGMVRDRDIAADCVQDTFCTVATRLETLREADKLRPWLYAIARNEALRRIRERQREQPSDELPETASSEPGPDTLAARTELALLISHAAGGLSERDREVLDLTYRHGLDGPELAQALGVSAASARTLTHRLRETVERSLGALLVARRAKTGQGCPELSASLVDWDGELTMLTRKRIARHIDSCSTCEDDRREMVHPVALLGAAPLFIPAPTDLRDRTLDRFELTCSSTDIPDPPVVDTPPESADSSNVAMGARGQRRLLPPVAAVIAAAGIALGLTLAWPESKPTPSTPVVETGAVTQPSPAQPRPPAAQAPLSSPRPLPPVVGPPTVGVAPSNVPSTPPAPQVNPAPAGAITPSVQAELNPLPSPGSVPPLQNSNTAEGDSGGTAPAPPTAPSVAIEPPSKTYSLTPPSKSPVASDTSSAPNSIGPSIKIGDPSGSLSSTSGGPSNSPTKPGVSSDSSSSSSSPNSSSSGGASESSANATKK